MALFVALGTLMVPNVAVTWSALEPTPSLPKSEVATLVLRPYPVAVMFFALRFTYVCISFISRGI